MTTGPSALLEVEATALCKTDSANNECTTVPAGQEQPHMLELNALCTTKSVKVLAELHMHTGRGTGFMVPAPHQMPGTPDPQIRPCNRK